MLNPLSNDYGYVAVGSYYGTSNLTAYDKNGLAYGVTLPASATPSSFALRAGSDGSIAWVLGMGSGSGSESNAAIGVAADSVNASFTIGGTFSSGTFAASNYDNSGLGGSLSNYAAGSSESFLASYTAGGQLRWLGKVSSQGSNNALCSIKVSANSDVYVAGTFSGSSSTQFYSSNGLASSNSVAATGTSNIFLAKYSGSGECLWATKIGGACNESRPVLTTVPNFPSGILNNNGLVITGLSDSPSLIAYHASNLYNTNVRGFTQGLLSNASPGTSMTFMAKYSVDGVVQATCKHGDNNVIVSMAPCPDGDVVFGGYALSNLSLFNSLSNVSVTSQSGFVAKYSCRDVPYPLKLGQTQWVSRIATTGATSVQDTDLHAHTDGVVLVGNNTVTGTTMTAYYANGEQWPTSAHAPNGNQSCVVSYKQDGAINWMVRLLKSSGTGLTVPVVARLSNGNYLAAGSFDTSTILNADNTTFVSSTLTNIGLADAYMACFDSSGTGLWTARVAQPSGSGSVSNTPTALIPTPDGGFVICLSSYETGNTNGAAAYSASGTMFGTTLTLQDSSSPDVVLVKYSAAGQVQWLTKCASTAMERPLNGVSLADGSIVIGGYYTGADLSAYNASSPNSAPFATTAVFTSTACYFLVKYSSGGSVSWLSRLVSGGALGAYSMNARCVATTSDNCVVLTGTYQTSLIAYNATGSAFGTSLATSSGVDIFIAKYSVVDGSVSWIVRFSSPNAESYPTVSTLSDGRIVIAFATATGTVTYYSPRTFAYYSNIGISATSAIAVAVLSSIGAMTQVMTATSTTGLTWPQVSTSPDNAVYLTGGYTGSGAGTEVSVYHADKSKFNTMVPSAGDATAHHMFLAKWQL